MNKTVKIILVFLIVSVAALTFFKIRYNNHEEVVKNNLKGAIVFANGKNDLNILKLPSMTLNNVIAESNLGMLFPSYPSWSPDGQQIALSQYKDNIGLMTIINLKNGNIKELSDVKLDCDYLSWSPNGEHIAFLASPIKSDNHKYTIYIFSTKDRRYYALSNILAGPYRPTWSPDSSKIVFSSSDNRIFIVNIYNKKMEQIISSGASPTWSPDGNFIVYRARSSVYLFNMQNNTEKLLILNLGFSDIRDFAWSPDSQFVVFKKITDSYSPIEIISIDGKVKVKLKEFGNIRGFSWKY